MSARRHLVFVTLSLAVALLGAACSDNPKAAGSGGRAERERPEPAAEPEQRPLSPRQLASSCSIPTFRRRASHS